MMFANGTRSEGVFDNNVFVSKEPSTPHSRPGLRLEEGHENSSGLKHKRLSCSAISPGKRLNVEKSQERRAWGSRASSRAVHNEVRPGRSESALMLRTSLPKLRNMGL